MVAETLPADGQLATHRGESTMNDDWATHEVRAAQPGGEQSTLDRLWQGWAAELLRGVTGLLAQTDADATSYRFPVCVYDKLTAKDADISVKFKPISGQKDQAAGLVWRYRDKDNYYIVRANANENNVVLYKIQNGKREDLPLKGEGRTYGKKAPVPKNQWSDLRVTAKGNLFTVYLNGEKLYEVEDATFTEAGKVGLWTKADSVTYFDDLEVKTK